MLYISAYQGWIERPRNQTMLENPNRQTAFFSWLQMNNRLRLNVLTLEILAILFI